MMASFMKGALALPWPCLGPALAPCELPRRPGGMGGKSNRYQPF